MTRRSLTAASSPARSPNSRPAPTSTSRSGATARKQTVKVKLGTFPGSKDEVAKLERGGPSTDKVTALDQLGLSLAPGKVKEGVAIAEVEQSSDASEKGLKAGDVILEVGGTAVAAGRRRRRFRRPRKPAARRVLLQVKSGDQTGSSRCSSRRADPLRSKRLSGRASSYRAVRPPRLHRRLAARHVDGSRACSRSPRPQPRHVPCACSLSKTTAKQPHSCRRR